MVTSPKSAPTASLLKTETAKKRTRISVGKVSALPKVDEKIKKKVKPKRLPLRKNMGIMCKTLNRNKGICCKPTTISKAVQTVTGGNKKFHLNPFNAKALNTLQRFHDPATDLEENLTTYVITYIQDNDLKANVEPIFPIVGQRKPSDRVLKNTAKKRSRQAKLPMMLIPFFPELTEQITSNLYLKYPVVVNVWNEWVTSLNAVHEKLFHQLAPRDLSNALSLFVTEIRKPNKGEYAPDIIYYLCLGIQMHLLEKGRFDNIFFDASYQKFINLFDQLVKKFSLLYNDCYYIVTRIEEAHLWESKQLGAYSPMVLLNTLMFFNAKYFNLSTVGDHMKVSFTQIVKDWSYISDELENGDNKRAKHLFLRYFPLETATDCIKRKKKFYELNENKENELRCPVKFYEFYMSKCPESAKMRNDIYYLLPKENPTPDSPVWFTTTSLPQNTVQKMFNRIKMVREINVAFLIN